MLTNEYKADQVRKNKERSEMLEKIKMAPSKSMKKECSKGVKNNG